MGGDRQLLAELAELFLQECPKWMTELRAALKTQDFGRVQLTAHTLKGGLHTFAAKSACEAARQLEIMGRNGDTSGAAEVLAALAGEVERLQLALEALAKEAHRSDRLP